MLTMLAATSAVAAAQHRSCSPDAVPHAGEVDADQAGPLVVGVAVEGLAVPKPALLTRIESPPSASAASSTAAVMAPASATSARSTATTAPSPGAAPVAPVSVSPPPGPVPASPGSMSTTATRAPSRASRSATARPMPRDPPVTSGAPDEVSHAAAPDVPAIRSPGTTARR